MKQEITFQIQYELLTQRLPKLRAEKLCKCGWIETHYHLKKLLRKSYDSVVVIVNSIEAGLRRCPTVWRKMFSRHKTINMGIGGDLLENVLWCINDIVPKYLGYC